LKFEEVYYLGMQSNYCKCKSKDECHDNKEHIETTVMTGGIKPHEEHTREGECREIANHSHYQQSYFPEISNKML
jgi:hypothetical protein